MRKMLCLAAWYLSGGVGRGWALIGRSFSFDALFNFKRRLTMQPAMVDYTSPDAYLEDSIAISRFTGQSARKAYDAISYLSRFGEA